MLHEICLSITLTALGLSAILQAVLLARLRRRVSELELRRFVDEHMEIRRDLSGANGGEFA